MLRAVVLLGLCALIRTDSVSEDDTLACCSAEDRQELMTVWGKVWSARYIGRRILIAQSVFEE